jgi:hypothetical protein
MSSHTTYSIPFSFFSFFFLHNHGRLHKPKLEKTKSRVKEGINKKERKTEEAHDSGKGVGA